MSWVLKRQDGSFEHPKQLFKLMGKKIIAILRTKRALQCLSISDTVKNITAGQLALLVLKGIQEFPSSSDKLKGTIDIWWIVHILYS